MIGPSGVNIVNRVMLTDWRRVVDGDHIRDLSPGVGIGQYSFQAVWVVEGSASAAGAVSRQRGVAAPARQVLSAGSVASQQQGHMLGR